MKPLHPHRDLRARPPAPGRPRRKPASLTALAALLAAILAFPATAQEEKPPGSGHTSTQPTPGHLHGKPPTDPPTDPPEKPDGLVPPFRPKPEPEPEPPEPTPTPAPAPSPSPTPAPTPRPAPTPAPAPTPSKAPANPAAATRPSTGGATTQTPRGTISSRRRGRTTTMSQENWEMWWRFNRDAFLIRKKYRPGEAPISPDAGLFLGRRVKNRARAGTPDRAALRRRIVPVLVEALEDRSPVVRASACYALGKVGRSEHVPRLVGKLRDTTSFVREAAVLGLGLLGQDEGRPALLSLLKADANGQSLRGGRKPEDRMRALAALGLGLIGTDRNGEVMDALARVAGHRSAPRDMTLMAAIGLGLLKGEPRYVDGVSRTLESLATRRRKVNDWVRAQAVTSIQRLLGRNGLPPEDRVLVGLHRLMTTDRTHHIRRSAVTAFGSVVTAPAHRTVAARLLAAQRDRAKDSHTRSLAAISLGRIGGDIAYRSLCKGVKESASQNHRAYAAFGLAILMRQVKDTTPERIAYDLGRGERCLRAAFDREKNLSTRSALALALGIARDRDSGSRLLRALRSTKDQTFRGYVSLALGMLEHQAAVPDLTDLVLHTKYAPHIKERIALGLGIIGVKNLLPLIRSLGRSRTAYDLDAIVRAVGLVGDHTAVEPLTALATDRRAQNRTRAATCEALGILGDPRPIPALASIRADHNYLASSGALNEILMRTF